MYGCTRCWETARDCGADRAGGPQAIAPVGPDPNHTPADLRPNWKTDREREKWRIKVIKGGMVCTADRHLESGLLMRGRDHSTDRRGSGGRRITSTPGRGYFFFLSHPGGIESHNPPPRCPLWDTGARNLRDVDLGRGCGSGRRSISPISVCLRMGRFKNAINEMHRNPAPQNLFRTSAYHMGVITVGNENVI